jgi:plastocyanin
MAFDPSERTVSAGTTVIWTNEEEDNTSHSIVIDGVEGGTSETLAPGDTFEYTFTTTGTYTYSCGIHPEMTGTITVE